METLLPFAIVWSAPIVGTIIAVIVWLAGPRTPLVGITRVGTLAASTVVAAALITVGPLYASGLNLNLDLFARTTLPLAAGAVGVVLLISSPHPRVTGVAELTPRTVSRFAHRGLNITLGVLVAASIAAAVIGGLSAGSRGGDNAPMAWIGTGKASAGTSVYGWQFGIPAVVALAALTLMVVTVLFAIARPPLSSADDESMRRTRSRNVALIACGAVLFHLGVVLSSLRGTAGLTLVVEGHVTTTPFAGLTTPLFVASISCTAAAYTAVVLVALSTIPSRSTPARSR